MDEIFNIYSKLSFINTKIKLFQMGPSSQCCKTKDENKFKPDIEEIVDSRSRKKG